MQKIHGWNPAAEPAGARTARSVIGGMLVQDADAAREDLREATVATTRAPSADEQRALAFAWKVVKHVKSNAIVFAGSDRTLSVGGGQTSRVEAIRTAVARAQRLGIALAGSALASDAFFPFPDGLEEAAQAGATAVVQPGGSNRDQQVVEAADRGFFALIELPEELGVTAEEVRHHLLARHDTGIVSIKPRYLRLAICSVAAEALPELVQRVARGVEELAAGVGKG